MTERGKRQLARSARDLAIGPSQLHWDGNALHIDIDEVGMPVPRRVRGRVRVHPQGLCRFVAPLDAQGRHRWGPIAPCARIEVEFDVPGLHWSGHAYLDSNEGDEPVDHAFHAWDWSRATMSDGSTAVMYDVRARGASRDAQQSLVARRFGADGASVPFEPPARQALPRSAWWIERATRTAPGAPARVVTTLEDTPFYVRSVVEQSLCGERVTAMHESLDVPRLVSLPVQCMLPCRMPRRA
ncbi:MAG: carotenoid 1,2-hydratase [Rubrivivax sp.]|nr:carotenoid 1,2-hydratase [Rubrivivax sp.]MDH5338902.1 carotenoid 1,2-hydratase [Rubrivivax sp.]